MKKFLPALLTLVIFLASPAHAQEEVPPFTLRLTRDFGYGGFNNDIEGLFSMRAEELPNLVRVDFYIDEEIIFSDTEAPYRVQFTTKDFSPGEHRLYAIGTTNSGEQLLSNEFTRTFLSPEQAQQKLKELIIPLLAIVAVIVLLTAGIPMLIVRKKPEIGKYGLSGGAVCPKCALPSPLHIFSLHMGASNLERCPHCGKWSWVRRAKPADLAAAEARWREDEQPRSSGTDVDKRLKQQIDDSRYEN